MVNLSEESLRKEASTRKHRFQDKTWPMAKQDVLNGKRPVHDKEAWAPNPHVINTSNTSASSKKTFASAKKSFQLMNLLRDISQNNTGR